jgi:uncharacterized membrane protein
MSRPPAGRLEVRVGRWLGAATVVAVALLAVGSVALLAAGHSPLDAAPALDAGRLVTDITTLQPAGLLWLGLIVVVATPVSRVAAALGGYAGRGERAMAAISVGILAVIAAGVIAGIAGA